jgi:hypothetical protein
MGGGRGKGAGTGSPVWFRCWLDRQTTRGQAGVDHVVTLTGRTRPYRPKRRWGSRASDTVREYKCSCGYTGWSNHVDLERMAS